MDRPMCLVTDFSKTGIGFVPAAAELSICSEEGAKLWAGSLEVRVVYCSRHPNVVPKQILYSSPFITRILALKRPQTMKKCKYYVYLDPT